MTTLRFSTAATARVSLLVAVLSLVVAASATGYAAGLARNSVGTPQLKNSAVTTEKLHGDAVTAAKIRNGTVARNDLAPGVRPARPVDVERQMGAGDPDVEMARLNGLVLTAKCIVSGADGVIALVDIVAEANAGAPPNPLSGVTVTARRDALATSADVLTAGNDSTYASQQSLAYSAGTGSGGTVTTGIVQYLDRVPVRVDIGVTANGGLGRNCEARVVLVPLR